MKKKIIILNAVLLVCAVLLVWYFSRESESASSSFAALPVYSAGQEDLLSGKSSSDHLLSLHLDSYDLPFDAAANVHYIAYERLAECRIEHSAGVKVYLTEPIDPETAANKMARNEPYTLLAVTEKSYQIYRLGLTNLPLLDFKILEKHDKDTPIKEKDTLGAMTLYNIGSGSAPAVEMALAQLKIRGGTSRAYPQKSYAISFVGEDLQPRAMSFLGFRSLLSYDLITIYEDSSKIRDKLSSDLWNQFGAHSNAYGIENGFRMEFVEVFIDNTYWGIYAIAEAVDETLLQLDENGVLYKVYGNAVPSVNDILNIDGNSMDDPTASVGLKYPRTFAKGNWMPFADYMEKVYYSTEEEFRAAASEYVDLDNMIDMWIFMNVVNGRDNTWKNIYFSNRGGKTMLLTPWDFDLTFGAGWRQDGNLDVWFNPDTTDMWLNFIIGNRFLENDISGMKQKLLARWEAVRDDILSEANIARQAESLYARLQASGVLLRNHTRWENSAYAEDIEEILTWIPQRLAYVDRYIREICAKEG